MEIHLRNQDWLSHVCSLNLPYRQGAILKQAVANYCNQDTSRPAIDVDEAYDLTKKIKKITFDRRTLKFVYEDHSLRLEQV